MLVCKKYSRVPNNRQWPLIYIEEKSPPGRAYLGPDVYLILEHLAAWTFIRTMDVYSQVPNKRKSPWQTT